MYLGWSSCVYPLEAADVAPVPDYSGPAIPAEDLPLDGVVLFIRPDGPDCLLRGRETVSAAAPRETVPVRVVFKPSVAKWNLFATLIRVFRNGHRYHGTRIYHISPKAIRRLGLERAIRSIDNPQRRKGKDRQASMARLVESLRRDGFRDDKPINMMLCRTKGLYDSVRQGHHRISACIELGIDRMAMEFSAVGVAPWQRWVWRAGR